MINGVVHDIPPEFLQIKQNDKFFSRLLSRERSKGGGESSFRVLYYGGACGSIPFMWESQPGTPKHPFSDNSLPPLTPPPSYQLSPRSKAMRRHYSKPNFLSSIFGRRNSTKSENDKTSSFSSSSSLSSSSSSSHSLPSTPRKKHSTQKENSMRMPRSMSAVRFGVHDDVDEREETDGASPTSTLCFGAGIKFGSGRPMKKVMKRAFLSIAPHGSA